MLARKVAQQVEGPCHLAWQLEFDPQDLHSGRGNWRPKTVLWPPGTCSGLHMSSQLNIQSINVKMLWEKNEMADVTISLLMICKMNENKSWVVLVLKHRSKFYESIWCWHHLIERMVAVYGRGSEQTQPETWSLPTFCLLKIRMA